MGPRVFPAAQEALWPRGNPRWARWLQDRTSPWLLSLAERGNDAFGMSAWSEGNVVQALVHGRSYLPALAQAVAQAGSGDVVLLAGWRADPDQLLDDAGPSVAAMLIAAAHRGVLVRGLLWHSHLAALGYSLEAHRELARAVNDAGGQILLDQRVRALGSHHQKFVVVTGRTEVAFLGGIDVAHARRDDVSHTGDIQARPFSRAYGPTPAWHDVQLELRGPVVRDVETVFRQRWTDPARLTRLPWHTIPARLSGLPQSARPLPPPAPPAEPAGSCTVQLLRSYPRRHPAYPFAPHGERSVARGYAKALTRARRLVYVEDQYLWSREVARVFAAALRRSPSLQLIAVVPRYPDQEGWLDLPAYFLGQSAALQSVLAAGGDRVQVVNPENEAGRPIYVHAKVCIIDDVWAAVGSANLNRRSWTHDSELTAAIVDEQLDDRHPLDPGGLGDGARHFARELRLTLMREHLGRAAGEDKDLLDADCAADAVRYAAARLDAWYAKGCRGPRPPGRLRSHPRHRGEQWGRRLVAPLYDLAYDPDGRPWRMRLRKQF
ncbi:phospholipase D family protein [Geodermatophilus sp. DSM 44513]|uniref:phospholipase D family protein n=1 Tax=Geodermatophilus sp. DSM 44513 TaxID=1528104 RepID=UPI00127CED3F|nr:phospholipase D family protein [Geodermatophilus sp. DSM 44513]WNV75225.1 phospholipase D family protein [Geodermatophilus sp. DSM 44513]